MFSNAGINGNGIALTVGKDVTAIPTSMFCPYLGSAYAAKIVTVVFEEGSVCESIGVSAFKGTTSLTTVILPDSVTFIGNYAFEGCTALTTFVFPTGVKQIGTNISDHNVFKGCANLTVYYRGTSSEWAEVVGFKTYIKAVKYYSAEAPSESGKYWHYDENGNVAVW